MLLLRQIRYPLPLRGGIRVILSFLNLFSLCFVLRSHERPLTQTPSSHTTHPSHRYISELCPDSLRGNVGSLVEASLATGLLICNFIAYAFISVDDGSAQLAAGWRAFYYGAYVVAIVYLVAVANNLPKTPFNMFKYGWIGLDGSRKKYVIVKRIDMFMFRGLLLIITRYFCCIRKP